MLPLRPASTLLLALCLLPFAGCPGGDEVPRDGTDIVIQNAGTEALARVVVNGVDQGSLEPSGVITLDDVGQGEFVIQAYRAGDAAPCAEYRTGVIARGETVHHAFDCARP
ncbi:MAG: hypothetical protein U0166_29095 [Acidobacteriota bacterium]